MPRRAVSLICCLFYPTLQRERFPFPNDAHLSLDLPHHRYTTAHATSDRKYAKDKRREEERERAFWEKKEEKKKDKMPSLSQTTLSITILLSAIGTYLSLTPPHHHSVPSTSTSSSTTSTINGEANADAMVASSRILPTGDFMRQFGLTGKVGTTIGPLPCVLLAVHLAVLVFFYPDIPGWLLLGFGGGDGSESGVFNDGSESESLCSQTRSRSQSRDNDNDNDDSHNDNNNTTTTTSPRKKKQNQTANKTNPPNPSNQGKTIKATKKKKNTLNAQSLTPSRSTIPPLLLLLLFAIPLRLHSYVSLGQNFTFHLAAPDKLITTRIYSYVQHPSYTCQKEGGSGQRPEHHLSEGSRID